MKKKSHSAIRHLQIILILLLVAMLVTGFTGCDDDSDTLEHETGSPSSPQTAPVRMIETVSIPAGSFQMGNSGTTSVHTEDEVPVHTVTLSPFTMSKYEITYGQWIEVTQWGVSHDYKFRKRGNMGSKGFYDSTGDENESHPVTYITWYDAILWCNALSEKEGLVPCYYTTSSKSIVYRSGEIDLGDDLVDWEANGYRLPTEAEWEYACRADTATEYSFGDNLTETNANYVHSGDIFDNGTTPVGFYAANQWGLYDMHGNVFEWCWDWYDMRYYDISPAASPHGPSDGTARVIRGGSWYHNLHYTRSAFRGGYSTTTVNDRLGFRTVRASS